MSGQLFSLGPFAVTSVRKYFSTPAGPSGGFVAKNFSSMNRTHNALRGDLTSTFRRIHMGLWGGFFESLKHAKTTQKTSNSKIDFKALNRAIL